MSIVKVNKIQNLNSQEIIDASSGTIVLPAGSASRAPLQFTAGPGVTVPAAGNLEFNGNTFLTTSSAVSGREFNDASLFYGLDQDRALIATVVANTFYSAFGVGINVPAGSAYVFDIVMGLRTGATSHTVSFNFGGTATFAAVQYRTEFTNLALSTGAAAPGTPTAAVTLMFTGNPTAPANGVISPASTLVSKFLRIHGLVEVNGGGTIDPQLSFSANPTGTNAVTALSYARFNSVGAFSGDLVAGNWTS
jgi:hypothetical protein